MSPEQIERLASRFTECQVEWRRLAHAQERDSFLSEAWGQSLPTGPLPPVHQGEAGQGFTLADALILETGSIVLSGRYPEARQAAFLAEVHYALAAEEALHETLGDFLLATLPTGPETLRSRFGYHLTLITGPSHTADIEKILVLGAHGPHRLVLGTAPAALIAERFPVPPSPGAEA